MYSKYVLGDDIIDVTVNIWTESNIIVWSSFLHGKVKRCSNYKLVTVIYEGLRHTCIGGTNLTGDWMYFSSDGDYEGQRKREAINIVPIVF